MQISIALPDNLPLTEADVRIEWAIVLDRQHSPSLEKTSQLATISVDNFPQISPRLSLPISVLSASSAVKKNRIFNANLSLLNLNLRA
jgi:hypothetical protein